MRSTIWSFLLLKKYYQCQLTFGSLIDDNMPTVIGRITAAEEPKNVSIYLRRDNTLTIFRPVPASTSQLKITRTNAGVISVR